MRNLIKMLLIMLILASPPLFAEEVPVTITITPKCVNSSTYLTVGLSIELMGEGVTATTNTSMTFTKDLEPTTITLPLQLTNIPETKTLKVTVVAVPGTGLSAALILDYFVMATTGVKGLTISTTANLVDVCVSVNFAGGLGVPAIPLLALGIASLFHKIRKHH